MTGNTVLLGIAVAHGRGADIARAATALAGFSLGALVGTRLARGRAAFGVEALGLLVAAVADGWLSHFAAVAGSACAMGAQTAALRTRTPDGVRVTYITGTVTTLWARVAGGDSRAASVPAFVWVVYAAGGASGALLAKPLGSAALLLPVCVVLLTAIAWLRPRASAARRPPRRSTSE